MSTLRNSSPNSEERTLLAQTVRDLIAKHAGPEAVRAAMESERGYDENLWRLLCEQVGVAALVVPEEFGGVGAELADVAAVLTELGRALVPSPLLGSTLAELALLAAEQPDTDTLEQLAAGAAVGAVAFDPDYVPHGDVADVVIGVEGGALVRWTEFTATALPTMDLTRRLAAVRATATEPLGSDPGLSDIAAVLMAAESVGAAARCLELTVEYSKERVQFGRPIGSFQALKHRMADLYVAVQTAQSVVEEALQDLTPTSAALAHINASEALSAVAADAVQIHGGIAITWEHDIQLYFKRAHAVSQLLGQPAEVLRQLEAEALAADVT